jgi:hypothetical protein
MNTEQDYIDKLYSEKFEKFEFQNSDEEWNRLNSKLGRSNFLKFSFATFNMYFLIIFVAFAGTASYLGVTSIKKSQEIKKLEEKLEILQKQGNKNQINLIYSDSLLNENEKNNQEKLKTINVEKKRESYQNAIDIHENNLKNIQQLNQTKDSVLINQDTSSLIKPVTPKIKRVKKTVFIKKDKVILQDTVIIKKGK